MLKRVEEVGVHAAAGEFGIAWQTLARIRRQAAGGTGTEKKAEAKEKPNRQKSLRTAAQEQVATDLETENAILRKQVKQMTTTLESIKKALARILDEV
jgi:transposase-like protein